MLLERAGKQSSTLQYGSARQKLIHMHTFPHMCANDETVSWTLLEILELHASS
jgi:hypothetical protein